MEKGWLDEVCSHIFSSAFAAGDDGLGTMVDADIFSSAFAAGNSIRHRRTTSLNTTIEDRTASVVNVFLIITAILEKKSVNMWLFSHMGADFI